MLRFSIVKTVAVCCGLLTTGSACGEPAESVNRQPADAPVPAVGNASSQDIPIIADMLGVQVAFLESKVGPARTVDGDQRNYQLGTCEVRVWAQQGAVTGYAVALQPDCSTQALPALKAYGLPQKLDLTFGEFADARQNAEFKSECLASCGNAFDPWVYLESSGPRVSPGIRAGSPQVTDAVIDAADRIETQIRAAKDEDYLFETRFNCDGEFNQIAVRELRNVRVEDIEVGYAPIRDCN